MRVQLEENVSLAARMMVILQRVAERGPAPCTSMPPQLLRPATSNHPFITHAARVAACAGVRCGVLLLGERAVERSEERG